MLLLGLFAQEMAPAPAAEPWAFKLVAVVLIALAMVCITVIAVVLLLVLPRRKPDAPLPPPSAQQSSREE